MAKDDTVPPSSIRIPPDLKAAVMKLAEAANRTFSQEVVWALQNHVAQPIDKPTPTSPVRPPSPAYERALETDKKRKR